MRRFIGLTAVSLAIYGGVALAAPPTSTAAPAGTQAAKPLYTNYNGSWYGPNGTKYGPNNTLAPASTTTQAAAPANGAGQTSSSSGGGFLGSPLGTAAVAGGAAAGGSYLASGGSTAATQAAGNAGTSAASNAGSSAGSSATSTVSSIAGLATSPEIQIILTQAQSDGATRAAVPAVGGGMAVQGSSPGATVTTPSLAGVGLASNSNIFMLTEALMLEMHQTISDLNNSLSGQLKAIQNGIGQSTTSAASSQANTQALLGGAQVIAAEQLQTSGQNSVVYGGCQYTNQAKGILVGQTAAENARQQWGSDPAEHKRIWQSDSPAAANAKDSNISSDELTPLNTSGQDGTLTDQQAAAMKDIVDLSVNPTPPPQLPASAAATQAGQRYDNMRKTEQAGLVVPEAAMQRVTVWRLATMDTSQGNSSGQDWVQMLWSLAAADNSDPPPGAIKTPNGTRISEDGVLDIIDKQHFAGANWHAKLSTENQSGELREIAEMEAVRLHMQYRQMLMQEDANLMLAQIAAAIQHATLDSSINALAKQAVASGGAQ